MFMYVDTIGVRIVLSCKDSWVFTRREVKGQLIKESPLTMD